MDHNAMQLRMRSASNRAPEPPELEVCASACVSPLCVRCLGVLLAATLNLENELKLDFISELLLRLLVYSNAVHICNCEWFFDGCLKCYLLMLFLQVSLENNFEMPFSYTNK